MPTMVQNASGAQIPIAELIEGLMWTLSADCCVQGRLAWYGSRMAHQQTDFLIIDMDRSILGSRIGNSRWAKVSRHISKAIRPTIWV